MGLTVIHPMEYARLCGEVLPKVIEDRAEFDRQVQRMEALDILENPTPEESVLAELLANLIQDYDDRNFPNPEIPPHEMIQYLMEQRDLKQADLVEIIGSRSQVSDMVTGKRAVSKSQAKKLAAFFHTSTDLFL